jgi:rhomboid protease GluP
MTWTRGGGEGAWLVKAIITVNIVVYVISILLGMGRGSAAGPLAIFSPDQMSLRLLGATGTVPIDRGWFWTLLTANYLHGGILHLLFNLMALRQIAPLVNQEYGPSRMFTIYTLGGVFGYLISYLAGVGFTIGASGAVCGLIGALLYYGRSRGGVYGTIVFSEVRGWVISLALFGFIMPGINNWAHGGGIVGGLILGMALGYEERNRENVFHRIVAMVCAVVTFGVFAWTAYIVFINLRMGY